MSPPRLGRGVVAGPAELHNCHPPPWPWPCSPGLLRPFSVRTCAPPRRVLPRWSRGTRCGRCSTRYPPERCDPRGSNRRRRQCGWAGKSPAPCRETTTPTMPSRMVSGCRRKRCMRRTISSFESCPSPPLLMQSDVAEQADRCRKLQLTREPRYKASSLRVSHSSCPCAPGPGGWAGEA